MTDKEFGIKIATLESQMKTLMWIFGIFSLAILGCASYFVLMASTQESKIVKSQQKIEFNISEIGRVRRESRIENKKNDDSLLLATRQIKEDFLKREALVDKKIIKTDDDVEKLRDTIVRIDSKVDRVDQRTEYMQRSMDRNFKRLRELIKGTKPAQPNDIRPQ